LPRVLSTLLVLGVLAGSAAAFAVSEGLKVQKAAITAVHVDKTLSPLCDCPRQRAAIDFKLTRSDRLLMSVVDARGRAVRTLVRGRVFARGKHHFTWNGRDDAGEIVPEAPYRPRVHLERTGRTLTLPNPIVLDVTPPRIAVVSVRPAAISPDGDGRSDVLRVRYRLSEHAHALLYVSGKQRVRSRFARLRDEIDWYGKVGGRTLPSGTYRLELGAIDTAGNRARRVSIGAVRLRFVVLAEPPLRARAGSRVAVSVSTDARSVRWTLRRGSSLVGRGSGKPRVVLRAPGRPGRYVLVVEAAGHRSLAALVVAR
jgi:FlgD Ig-like domain